jgi:hypothetical protein
MMGFQIQKRGKWAGWPGTLGLLYAKTTPMERWSNTTDSVKPLCCLVLCRPAHSRSPDPVEHNREEVKALPLVKGRRVGPERLHN